MIFLIIRAGKCIQWAICDDRYDAWRVKVNSQGIASVWKDRGCFDNRCTPTNWDFYSSSAASNLLNSLKHGIFMSSCCWKHASAANKLNELVPIKITQANLDELSIQREIVSNGVLPRVVRATEEGKVTPDPGINVRQDHLLTAVRLINQFVCHKTVQNRISTQFITCIAMEISCA